MTTRRITYSVELDNASARAAANQFANIMKQTLASANIVPPAATAAAGGASGAAAGAGTATAAAASAKATNPLLARFGASIAAFATVRTVQRMAEITNEMSKMAVQADNLETAFTKAFLSVGEDPQKMLESLQVASQGMASDVDLMAQAMKAMRLGVTSDIDEMTKLMEVAAKRGQEFGRTTAQAFNDITTGIGRLSPRILDNLGFLVKVDDAYTKYAETLGIAKEQMTTAQQRQAILNDVLDQASGEGLALANEHEQMGAALDNAQVAAGRFINAMTPYDEVVGSAAKATTNLADSLNNVSKNMDKIKSASPGFIHQIKLITSNMNNWQKVTLALSALVPVIGPAMIARTLGQGVNQAGESLVGTPPPINELSMYRRGRAPVDWRAGDAYIPGTQAWRDANPDEGGYSYEYGEAAKRLEKERETAAKKLAAEQERAAKKWTSAADQVEETWISTADSIADTWLSMIEKVPGLFGTSDVTQGQLDLADMGVGQNFADDYLRRLRDEVLNGVEWGDVSIGEAGAAIGVGGAPEAILAQFEEAWANSSLFEDEENMKKFLNMDAVAEYLQQQAKSEAGKKNLRALMGLGTEEDEKRLMDIGLEIFTPVGLGVEQAVMDQTTGGSALGKQFMQQLYKGFVEEGDTLNWISGMMAPIATQIAEEIYDGLADEADTSGTGSIQ